MLRLDFATHPKAEGATINNVLPIWLKEASEIRYIQLKKWLEEVG
jgi:hypothetical protein